MSANPADIIFGLALLSWSLWWLVSGYRKANRTLRFVDDILKENDDAERQ